MHSNATYSYYTYYLRYFNIAKYTFKGVTANPQLSSVIVETNFSKSTYEALYWNLLVLSGQTPAVTFYKTDRGSSSNKGVIYVAGTKKGVYTLLNKCKYTFLHYADDIDITSTYYRKREHCLTLRFADTNMTGEVGDFVPHLLDTFKSRVKLIFTTSDQNANINLARMLQLPVHPVVSAQFLSARNKRKSKKRI